MQIFNLLFASISSAMSLVLFVVVLLYYIYLDLKPELARDIPLLWMVAGLLGVIAVGAWTCVWARGSGRPHHRWFEVASVCLSVVCISLIVSLLR